MHKNTRNYCFNTDEYEAQPVIDMLSRMSIDGGSSYMLVFPNKEGLVQVVRYRAVGDTVWTLVALHDGPDVHCAASGQKVGDGAFERALAVCSWLLCIDETERPSMTASGISQRSKGLENFLLISRLLGRFLFGWMACPLGFAISAIC